MTQLHVAAIVLAAGRSTRMGADQRKPYLEIGGQSVLERACAAFSQVEGVKEIVVVASEADVGLAREITGRFGTIVVVGGDERTDSVRHGVAATSKKAQVILVHDAARPFVRPERIEEVARVAADRGAALLAVRVKDTIKTSRDGQEVSGTLDRDLLWAAQTPQGFDAERLRRVLAKACQDHFTPTDDAALFERYEGAVTLVEGDADNIKLTTPEDLPLGEAILRSRS